MVYMGRRMRLEWRIKTMEEEGVWLLRDVIQPLPWPVA